MLTLSNVASETRNILKWGGLVFGTILIIYISYQVGIFIKKTFYPTPPPPPTVSFGKLPSISFSESKQNQFEYTLDTLSGSFPTFSDREKVYKMVINEPDLLALKKASNKVKGIGFQGTTVALNPDVYQWTNQTPFAQTLSFNILTSDFQLSSSYFSDQNILSSRNLPDTSAAPGFITTYLQGMYLYPQDIDLAKIKTNLFSIKNNSLVPASSLSNAQIIQVYLFQKDVDKLPIFYSRPTISPMNFLVAGGENSPTIVQADFSHQEISQDSATYPIITASEAFDMLKKGQAYVADFYGQGSEISIKNIYLGYYIGENKQKYLMPIVVFEGNDGFYAYVSAIKDEWINK